MPEDCKMESDLDRVLDDLEDYTLNARNYQTLQSTLDSVNYITAPTAEKLLLLCIRDRIEDLKYAAHVLNIIATLLKKIKDGQCTPLPNLVPSALAVIYVLKTTTQVNKFETLKTLCFEIINSYPEETLISLCVSHSGEIFDIITSCCDHQDTDTIPEISGQPIKLLAKLLRILPPDKKATFVNDGIDIWFSVVIPLVVKQIFTSNTVLDLLETLEMLTDELVQFDYLKKTNWQKFSENIYTPERYPALVKGLLEKGNPYWHRLWGIFIKLLKSQITMNTPKTGTPINALLPCVETAFKMDVRNRCRAYLCWNVLIDTFSNDRNALFLNKGLKLLMVPLTSNNAKVEETALAKFKTWWYLIIRLQFKIDPYLESVVIPFLTFCFGKPSVTLLVPGMISEKMKVQCVQAFINIVGHSQCEGCVALSKLNVNLFKTSLLVSHWKDWFHSIRVAIRICVEQSNEFTEKQIKCVWKSFVSTIGQLPENNVRRDLYNEALKLLEGLTQDCDIRLMGVIVNVLIPTLFDKDDKIQALLKSKDEQNASVCKIITVLNKLPLDNLEDRKIAVESIKTFTNWIMDDAFETSNHKIECAVKTLPLNSMLLWTALAESMSLCVYSVCPKFLTHMFLWPFNFMNNFVNKEEATTAWLNLYKTIRPYLTIQSINKEIVKALMTHGDSQSSCVFVLSATIAVLEAKLQQEDPDLNEEIELILQLTSKITEVQIKLILPSLASVISGTLTALSKNTNVTIAEHLLLIINNILKICYLVFQQQFDVGIDLVKYIDNIFNSLESALKLDVYSKLKSHLVDQLKECAPYLKHDESLNNHILAIYKTSLNKNLADNIAEEVVQAFNSVNSVKQKADPQNFTTPSDKTAKKSKMGPSITDTVVENGEEFVVVKSNWKFNPRKLTENQKEKLQRKREDIPAMYQDLSQSQDDFKLNTWKTDSQDTSTTSSKSTNATANEDVSVILKNTPNSEFFPKIIENVSLKAVKNVTQDVEPSKEALNVNDKSENNEIKNVQTTIKDVKSPRMALKDRVFRNVRNLIERSNLEQECKDDTDILKTPLITKVKLSSNITTSTPSQIQSERPSRLRKKPKKFDDSEIISLRKRRRSLGPSDYQEDVEMPEHKIQEKMDHSKEVTIVIEDEDETKIVTEDKDKAKHMDSQVINKSNDNFTMVKGDIRTLKRHGNDESGENITVIRDCFVATENLNLTNNVVNRLLEKEKETACLDAKNIASSTLLVNQINIRGEQTFDPHELNLNNVDKPIHDKIKEKVEGKICTDDTLDKGLCTSKVNKPKDQKSQNISSVSKNKVLFSSPAKKEESIEIKEIQADESKCDAVPTLLIPITPVDNTKKKMIHDKSFTNNTDNRTNSTLDEKIETVKENIGNKICCDDNTDAVSVPKSQELINKPILSRKKYNTRKSRIESQLAIDMVEGHPFLEVQSEKRTRRKAIVKTPLKQIRLLYKMDNNKLKIKNTTKAESETKDKEKSILIKDTPNSEDISASQDFIESSQESAVTTISVKSSNPLGNITPIVILEDAKYTINGTKKNTQNLLDPPVTVDLTNMERTTDLTNIESNSDVELPYNKTNLDNLTEEMDTEPVDYTVIVSSEDVDLPLPVISKVSSLESDTQNTADAETQPMDPDIFLEKHVKDKPFDVDRVTKITNIPENNKTTEESEDIVENKNTRTPLTTTEEDITATLSESILIDAEEDDSGSSRNNDERKKEFLNSTLEISPIKSMSPVRDEKSPSPETSGDFVVIKLVSPVHSDGQPFVCESPEIFTEDKVSPDKRHRSPPREEVSAKNTSPSSSLSLKKNRPRMRSGGRAAQMLGLCVPDTLQTVITSDKPADVEEVKRSPSVNTSARRNLRILYNSTGEGSEESGASDDAEESESFLKFKRTLPATDCSPSGPILKRKLIDITDETTASPASKRKRVSFHDPPVSTTICVKKYIESIGIRSPQNSANKRQERQARAQTAVKSPKRLENVFKLDSVLNKAVESFSEAPETQILNEDTEMSSLDETPIVEVVKTSDLNDTDPICKELVDCEDEIANIAAELSSPAMQTLLVKTFEGKVETIGDLAKMSELEVNRLCIKAPKVQVVRKVLSEYLSKLKRVSEEITPTVEAAMSESSVLEAKTSIEVQTEPTSIESIAMQTDSPSVESIAVQTECLAVSLASSQTDAVELSHSFVQTNETGSKSTADIITDCISERPDFVERLCEIIEEPSKRKIVENLPCDMLIKLIMDKICNGDGNHVLSILQNQLLDKFESKNLILFCSNLLKKVYDKPT